MNTEEYYQEILLDHFKNPRCKGLACSQGSVTSVKNPSCGDSVTLAVSLKPNELLVEEIAFTGAGCSISQASASMMVEYGKGKSAQELKQCAELVRRMMKEALTEKELEQLGDIAALSGVRKLNSRIRCALLAWSALEDCLEKELTSKA